MIDVINPGGHDENEPSLESDFFKALNAEDRMPRLQEFRALSAEDRILWKRLFITKGGDADTSGTYEKLSDGTERKIKDKDELRASVKSERLQKRFGNPPGFTGSVVGSGPATVEVRDRTKGDGSELTDIAKESARINLRDRLTNSSATPEQMQQIEADLDRMRTVGDVKTISNQVKVFEDEQASRRGIVAQGADTVDDRASARTNPTPAGRSSSREKMSRDEIESWKQQLLDTIAARKHTHGITKDTVNQLTTRIERSSNPDTLRSLEREINAFKEHSVGRAPARRMVFEGGREIENTAITPDDSRRIPGGRGSNEPLGARTRTRIPRIPTGETGVAPSERTRRTDENWRQKVATRQREARGTEQLAMTPRASARRAAPPPIDAVTPEVRPSRISRNMPGGTEELQRQRQAPQRRTGIIGRIRDFIFGPPVQRTEEVRDQIPPAVRAWMNEATTIKGLTRRGEAAEHAIRKMRKIGVTEGAQIRTYLDIQNKLQNRNSRLARHALLGASMSALSGVVVAGVLVGGIPTTAALLLMAASGAAGSVVSATVGDVAARRGWKRPWAYAMASGIATGLATGSLYSLFDTTFTGTTSVEGGSPDTRKPASGLALIPSGGPLPDTLPSSSGSAVPPINSVEVIRSEGISGTPDSQLRPTSDIGPKMTGLETVPGTKIDVAGMPAEATLGQNSVIYETSGPRAFMETASAGAPPPLSPESLSTQFVEAAPSGYTVAAGDAVARQGIDGFVKSHMFNVPPLSEMNLTRVGKEQFIDAVRRVFVENPGFADEFIGSANRIVDGKDGLDLMFKAGDTLNQKIFADGEFLEKLKDTIMSKESVLTRQMGGSGGVESVVYDLSRTFSR